MTAPLDTLRIAKRLKDVGFSEAQAEAVTDVLSATRDADLSQLATKTDLAALRADLTGQLAATNTDIAALRTASKTDLALLQSQIETALATTKAEIIRWVFGTALGLAAMLIAAVKLFPPGHP